jgi:hypothetical protein
VTEEQLSLEDRKLLNKIQNMINSEKHESGSMTKWVDLYLVSLFILNTMLYLCGAWFGVMTNFRLIDDFGDGIILHKDFFNIINITFQNNIRFRPTWELGNILYWGIFDNNPALHHACRILIKFSCFFMMCHLVYKKNKLSYQSLLVCAIFIQGAFLVHYNIPEARLAPQEISLVFYSLLLFYCIEFKFRFNQIAFIIVSILFIGTKESAIISWPLFALLYYIKSGNKKIYPLIFSSMFWGFSLFRLFEISRNKSYGFNYNEGMMDREYFFNWTATELFDEPYFYILLLLLFFTKNIFDIDNFKKSNGLVPIFVFYFILSSVSFEVSFRYVFPALTIWVLLISASLNYKSNWILFIPIILTLNGLRNSNDFLSQFISQYNVSISENKLLHEINNSNNLTYKFYEENEYTHKILIYFNNYRKYFNPDINQVKFVKTGEYQILISQKKLNYKLFKKIESNPLEDYWIYNVSKKISFFLGTDSFHVDNGSPNTKNNTWFLYSVTEESV